MKGFLIIGNGQPALAIVREIVQRDCGPVSTILTSEPSGQAATLLKGKDGSIGMESWLKNPAALAELISLDHQWLLCANTQTIIPPSLVHHYQGRALNMHPGMLPEYAGLHTHQWAIRNGEKEFASTIHYVERGIDSGDIVYVERFPIHSEDSGLSLYRKAIKMGTGLLSRALNDIFAGVSLPRLPQDLSKRRLYRHVDALSDRIDWNSSAKAIVDFIRAGNYHPLTSPTYTARIRGFGPDPIEILHAREMPGRGGPSGQLLELTPTGPLFGTGDPTAGVLLDKATQGNKLVTEQKWQELVTEFGSLFNQEQLATCLSLRTNLESPSRLQSKFLGQ